MRVDTRPRHKNAGRPAEKDARGFLQWLRGRACVFALEGDCEGKIVAAHLDWAGGKGMGSKVADANALPFCWKHHALQHNQGWGTFMRASGVTREQLLGAAQRFWRAWPGRAKWERERG